MPASLQVVNVTPRYAKLRSNDRQVILASCLLCMVLQYTTTQDRAPLCYGLLRAMYCSHDTHWGYTSVGDWMGEY